MIRVLALIQWFIKCSMKFSLILELHFEKIIQSEK